MSRSVVEVRIEQVQRHVLREHGGPAARRHAAAEAGELAARVDAADDAAADRLAGRPGRHRDASRDVERRRRRAVDGEGAQLDGEVEDVERDRSRRGAVDVGDAAALDREFADGDAPRRVGSTCRRGGRRRRSARRRRAHSRSARRSRSSRQSQDPAALAARAGSGPAAPRVGAETIIFDAAARQRSKPQRRSPSRSLSRSTRRRGARSARRPIDAVRAPVSMRASLASIDSAIASGAARFAEREARQRKPARDDLQLRRIAAGAPVEVEVRAQLAGERRHDDAAQVRPQGRERQRRQRHLDRRRRRVSPARERELAAFGTAAELARAAEDDGRRERPGDLLGGQREVGERQGRRRRSSSGRSSRGGRRAARARRR